MFQPSNSHNVIINTLAPSSGDKTEKQNRTMEKNLTDFEDGVVAKAAGLHWPIKH